jgi:hypothetical protein
MYDFVLIKTLFLMFKSFLCIVCESFLVKLTLVEVHDKKESKLFSLASNLVPRACDPREGT